MAQPAYQHLAWAVGGRNEPDYEALLEDAIAGEVCPNCGSTDFGITDQYFDEGCYPGEQVYVAQLYCTECGQDWIATTD